MNVQRFEKNNSVNKMKALCFTLILHSAIIGSAYYAASGGEPIDLLPDFIKTYFEDPAEEAPQPKKPKKNIPRA